MLKQLVIVQSLEPRQPVDATDFLGTTFTFWHIHETPFWQDPSDSTSARTK